MFGGITQKLLALLGGEGGVGADVGGLLEGVELLEEEERSDEPVWGEDEEHVALVGVGHAGGIEALLEVAQLLLLAGLAAGLEALDG